VVEPLTTRGTKNVQKPSGQNNNARKRGLVSHANERKVRLEGRHNPLDGPVEESSN
jgi:hypothetical protein